MVSSAVGGYGRKFASLTQEKKKKELTQFYCSERFNLLQLSLFKQHELSFMKTCHCSVRGVLILLT